MVDGKRAVRRKQSGDRVQRNELSGSVADVEQRKRPRLVLELRLELHDHLILVVRRIDRRNLARAVCRIQCILDLQHVETEGGGAVAVDVDGERRILHLQIGGDVC